MECDFWVERVGLGGGITLLWKEVNLKIKSYLIGHIDPIVESGGVQRKWRFTGSMAIQTQGNARTRGNFFADSLISLICHGLCAGDFNEILDNSERWDKELRNQWQI